MAFVLLEVCKLYIKSTKNGVDTYTDKVNTLLYLHYSLYLLHGVGKVNNKQRSHTSNGVTVLGIQGIPRLPSIKVHSYGGPLK